MVISNWAAYILAVFRLVGGTLISVWDLSLTMTPDTVWAVTRTFAGALLGAFVYVVVLRKKSTAMRQGVSLAVVVLIAFVPLVPQIPVTQAVSAWISGRHVGDELSSYVQNYSEDGSVTVSITKPLMKAGYLVVMRSYRNGITRKRLFPECKVFKVQPDGRAYMARAKANGVEITEWNGVTDTVRTVATMPIRGRFFGGDCWKCDVSPDGRYMALILMSMFHDDTTDLWLVDMQRGTWKLVLPNLPPPVSRNQYNCYWNLAWPKDEVAVWTPSFGAVAVNLKTLVTRRISLKEEDKR